MRGSEQLDPTSFFRFISTPSLYPCHHPFRTSYLVPDLLIVFTPLSQHLSSLPRIPQFLWQPAQPRELRWLLRGLCVKWLTHFALPGTVLVLKQKDPCPRNLTSPRQNGTVGLFSSVHLRKCHKGSLKGDFHIEKWGHTGNWYHSQGNSLGRVLAISHGDGSLDHWVSVLVS